MPNLLLSPQSWIDVLDGESPPTYWTGATYHETVSAGIGQSFNMEVFGTTPPGYTATGTATMSHDGVSSLWLQLVNVSYVRKQIIECPVGVPVAFDWAGLEEYDKLIITDNNEALSPTTIYGLNALIAPGSAPPASDPLNCDCDCGFPTTTLGDMLSQLMPLMGYSAQGGLSTSIRANFVAQINLQQKLLVRDISEISSRRRFTWNAAIGDHKFCLSENLETCRNDLIASKISAVYWVGSGNVITRLDKGIDFQMYEAENPSSTPSRYDVRSCLEIWPKPVDAGKVVVEGTLAATTLLLDADKVMCDSTALLLRCLAFLKVGKGHEDAGTYSGQYWDYIGGLVADESMDRRIIPRGFGTRRERLCDEERLTHHMEPRTYD